MTRKPVSGTMFSPAESEYVATSLLGRTTTPSYVLNDAGKVIEVLLQTIPIVNEFQAILELSELISLSIGNVKDDGRDFSLDHMETVAKSKVTRFELYGRKFSNVAFQALTKIVTLEELSLRNCSISDDCLDVIGEMNRLSWINLAENRCLGFTSICDFFRLDKSRCCVLSFDQFSMSEREQLNSIASKNSAKLIFLDTAEEPRFVDFRGMQPEISFETFWKY